MPKKYQSRALLTKPSSSTPSTLESNKAPVANHGVLQERTVNDLIRESRIARPNDRNIDTAASSSLPPALRAVFDIPAPPPRTQLRGPARFRRIPGPPPPRSWLLDSKHAPEGSRDAFMQLRWLRARIQQQLSTLPGGRFPLRGSLEEIVIRRIALNWQWHAEYDHTYLATLPVRIKETLLSFLAIYDDTHLVNPLPLLFPPDSEQDDLDEVTRLDLANSLGSWGTVKKIEREILLSYSRTLLETTRLEEVVPESWDEATETHIAPEPVLRTLRFVNLKHLSLAINSASSGTPPSWASLLNLVSSGLSTLTSLSLANWPVPSYTPNASQGRVKIESSGEGSRPQALYGGTDYYTISDGNWQEASGILRSLSRNLYCLTWLDLSGCGTWVEALTYNRPEEDITGPDWNGSWRNIKHLDLSVGWLPGRPPSPHGSSTYSSSSIDSTRAIEQLYGNSEVIQQSLVQLTALRLGPRPPPDEGQPTPWNVEEEREKQYFRRDVERYLAQQQGAGKIANDIRSIRRKAGGAWIDVEIGPKLSANEINIS